MDPTIFWLFWWTSCLWRPTPLPQCCKKWQERYQNGDCVFVIFFLCFLYFRLGDYTNQGFFRLLPWLSAQFYIKISHFAKTYQVFLSSSGIIRTKNNFFITIGFLVQCPEHIVAYISHTKKKILIFVLLITDFQELPGWGNAGTNVEQV